MCELLQNDGGKLVAHRTIFGVPLSANVFTEVDVTKLPSHSITELCYIPDAVADGVYVLSLQVAPIISDAAPSRPVLFPIARVE